MFNIKNVILQVSIKNIKESIMKGRLKEKYIGDKAFYRRYLLLALPMIVQNAITNLVSFLDNIMVGAWN